MLAFRHIPKCERCGGQGAPIVGGFHIGATAKKDSRWCTEEKRNARIKANPLLLAAYKAEQWLRNFAGSDPGACLTAGSEHAEACELADEIAKAVKKTINKERE